MQFPVFFFCLRWEFNFNYPHTNISIMLMLKVYASLFSILFPSLAQSILPYTSLFFSFNINYLFYFIILPFFQFVMHTFIIIFNFALLFRRFCLNFFPFLSFIFEIQYFVSFNNTFVYKKSAQRVEQIRVGLGLVGI